MSLQAMKPGSDSDDIQLMSPCVLTPSDYSSKFFSDPWLIIKILSCWPQQQVVIQQQQNFAVEKLGHLFRG